MKKNLMEPGVLGDSGVGPHGWEAVAVGALRELVRIPSVSSDPARAGDVRRCAHWLAGRLTRAGLGRVRIVWTPRHPIVYGEWLGAPGEPTVLVYGHYDVQSAGHVGAWALPPFDAALRNGCVHGRSASDDTGQFLAHVVAIERFMRRDGRLPVNVKCLLEGEEEIGSVNLPAFLGRNRRALTADVAVMSDTRMLGPDRPAIMYSVRRQLALEVTVRGPRQDLHSGNFGGAVHNLLQVLCEMLARLLDSDCRIAIPGFYRRVRPIHPGERRDLARSGPSDAEIQRQTGAPGLWGERGYTVYERLTVRPSLSVTGMQGGHFGEGPKGVIPAMAKAKLSLRLVPDQDADEVERNVRGFLERIAPPTVRLEVSTQIRTRPAVVDRRHPAMRAAARAYRTAFGREPGWVRSGGSIPVVSVLQRRLLGLPTVLMGFASPGDNLHGPNERLRLANFRRGIETCMAFLTALGGGGERGGGP
jgi:acetylornithine deacetylase/succinyl-diaminopimelate desuccinylase-like protein